MAKNSGGGRWWTAIIWVLAFLIIGGLAGWGTYEGIKYFSNEKKADAAITIEAEQQAPNSIEFEIAENQTF